METGKSKLISYGDLVILSTRDADVHTLALRGVLDTHAAIALHEEMRKLESSDAERIVIDLEELELIDSVGIGVLERAAGRSERSGRPFSVLRPSPAVLNVLRVVGAADVLPLSP